MDSPPAVPSPLTSDLMKLFAFEAESAGDFELAEYYHQEVRTTSPASSTVIDACSYNIAVRQIVNKLSTLQLMI